MYKNIIYGLFLTLIIILLSVLYIVNKSAPKDFLKIIYLINKNYLFLSFFALFCFHTFDNLRIFVIARSLELHYSFLYGYVISLINTFGATITPFCLGGEILPFYTLKRIKGEIYKIMSIVTLKGFSGMVFYVLFSPFTIQSLLNNPKEAKELAILLLVIISLAIFLFFLWQILFKGNLKLINEATFIKIKYTVLRYFVTCKLFFQEKKGVFLLTLFFSFLMYISLLFVGIFLVKAFNKDVSIKNIFLTQLPLIYAIFMSPTPGGSGVGELGALYIFERFLTPQSAGVFAILWRFISQYFSASIGGILFLIILAKDIAKKNV